MSETPVHYHLWATNVGFGVELANAVFENKYDAALAWFQMASKIYQENLESQGMGLSVVVDTLNKREGVWIASGSLQLNVSTCNLPCVSTTWN